MKRFLFLILMAALPVTAQDGAPVCGDPSYLGSNLSLFGHSRMAQLIFRDGAIAGASHNGIRIIDPGTPVHIQNLGWGGSKATDSASRSFISYNFDARWQLIAALPAQVWSSVASACDNCDLTEMPQFQRLLNTKYVALLDPVSENNWNRRLAHCAGNGAPVQAADTLIVDLGGNDIREFMGVMRTYTAQYLFVRWITRPLDMLVKKYNNRDSLKREVALLWEWHMRVESDRVARGVEATIDAHMTNWRTGPHGLPHLATARVLLIGEAPAFDHALKYQVDHGCCNEDFFKYVFRELIFFRDFQEQLLYGAYPRLVAKYGDRVAYLDTYWPFLHNVLFQGASYYKLFDPITGPDGAHFTDDGLDQFGRMIALKLTDLGWFPRNPALANYDLSPLYGNQEPIFLPPVVTTITDEDITRVEPPPCDALCVLLLWFHLR